MRAWNRGAGGARDRKANRGATAAWLAVRRPARRAVPGSVALALLALLSGARAGAAQEPDGRIRVAVDYIAGSNLYVPAGTAQGIQAGDTLQVYRDRDGARLGAVVVVSSTRDRAVLAFAGAPFAVTRGVLLALEPGAGAAVAGRDPAAAAADSLSARGDPAAVRTDPAPRPARAANVPPPPPAVAAGRAPRRRPATGPRLDGRLALDLDVQRTSTRWGTGESQRTDRDVALPALRLHATATGLPGGARVVANVRASYRYSSLEAFEPERSVRVYQAAVEKDFTGAPLRLRLGRFYNPFTSFGGYWDGMLARVGGESAGAGVVFGYSPDRANEGFSTDVRKWGAFVDYRYRGRDFRYETDLAFHDERSGAEGDERQSVGWSQHVAWDRLRLTNRLELDRDPDGGWEVAYGMANLSVPVVAAGLRLNGRYATERPRLLRVDNRLPAYRRDRLSAGLSIAGAAGSVSLDAGTLRGDAGMTGRSYTASGYLPPAGALALGVGGSASYWDDGRSTALHVAPSVDRYFGIVHGRASFQLYRTRSAVESLLLRGGEATVGFPLGRVHATLGGRGQWGQDLSNVRLLAGLWMGF